MQRKMLLGDGLTLGKAVKIARSEERTAVMLRISNPAMRVLRSRDARRQRQNQLYGGQPSRQTDRRGKSGEAKEAARKACYRCSGRLRHVQLSWKGDFGFWHFHSS